MADYSELKRKAQEIRDEVKAGANTANRVGLALEEAVNALEAENQRAEQAEQDLQDAVQLLQDETEDMQSIRDKVERLGSEKVDKSALEATNKEVSKKQDKLEFYKEDPSNGSVEIFAQDVVSILNHSQGGVSVVETYNEEGAEGLIPVARMSAEKENGDSASVTVWGNDVHIDGDAVKVNGTIIVDAPSITLKATSLNIRDVTAINDAVFNGLQSKGDINIKAMSVISSNIYEGELKVLHRGSPFGFIIRTVDNPNDPQGLMLVELLSTDGYNSYKYSFPAKSGEVVLKADFDAKIKELTDRIAALETKQ